MNFRFEPILKLKKHVEEQCQYRLQKEEMKLSRIEAELKAWQETAACQEQFLETINTGKINPAVLSWGSRYLAFVRQREEEVTTRKSFQEKEVASARNHLLSARKETKSLEKLKERFFAREKERIFALEQKTLDEIGINFYTREKSGGE